MKTENFLQAVPYNDLATFVLCLAILCVLCLSIAALAWVRAVDARETAEELANDLRQEVTNLQSASISQQKVQHKNREQIIFLENRLNKTIERTNTINRQLEVEFKNGTESTRSLFNSFENSTASRIYKIESDIERLKKGKANKLSVSERKAARGK